MIGYDLWLMFVFRDDLSELQVIYGVIQVLRIGV